MTIFELEGQSFELLPSEESLFLYFGHNWAAVYVAKSSLAVNPATLMPHANSQALQGIYVVQSN